MRFKLAILIVASVLYGCDTVRTTQNQSTSKPASKAKILFVCTNVDEVNGKRNGTFLSEIAEPFILLEEAGYEIDIVSPKGGEIPIYYKFDTTEIIGRALESKYYQQQISSTLKPEEVKSMQYTALVLPGGYGQFWDIYANKMLSKIIAEVHENNGIIGALGHGTSSLVNVKLRSGEYLVKGKTMTCFPSWFEKEVMFEADYGKLLPFDMEVELKKNGAKLKLVDKETRSNGEIVDKENKFITASSGTGGVFIATEIIKMINAKQN